MMGTTKHWICLILFIVCAATTSGIAISAERAYTCKVERAYDLKEDGRLHPSVWEKTFRGSQFSVSRITGQIIGEVVPTERAESTRVVNSGSNKNSFKTIADFGDTFQLLEVQEFRKTDKKPFVAMSMSGGAIVTGFCE